MWTKNSLAIALTVLSALVVTDVTYAAGRTFYDGFEDGTTNQWAQDAPSPKCTVVTSALDGGVGPPVGTRMVRCNWDGINSDNDYRLIQPNWFSFTNEWFVRLRVRNDADVDHKFGSKWWRMYSNNPLGLGNNDMYVDGQMEQANGPIYDTLDVVDGIPLILNRYGSEPLGNAQWHQLEIYMKVALSGGGIYRLWLDNVLIHQETGWSGNPVNPWGRFSLVSNWSNNGPEWAHDANNHTYWDEVEVYTDLGTGGTGSMSAGTITQGGGDTTPPAAPTNVQIQ